ERVATDEIHLQRDYTKQQVFIGRSVHRTRSNRKSLHPGAILLEPRPSIKPPAAWTHRTAISPIHRPQVSLRYLSAAEGLMCEECLDPCIGSEAKVGKIHRKAA